MQTTSYMASKDKPSDDDSDWMKTMEVIPQLVARPDNLERAQIGAVIAATSSASSGGPPPPAAYHYVGDPTTDTPGPVDRKMMHGNYAGQMCTEIMAIDPEYPEKLAKRYECKRSVKIPMCITVLSSWAEAWRKHRQLAGLRTERHRRCGLPPKLASRCEDGCTRFTKLGSNQHMTKMTCLECGWSTSEPVHVVPKYKFKDWHR